MGSKIAGNAKSGGPSSSALPWLAKRVLELCAWCGVWGLGCRVQGAGCRVEGHADNQFSWLAERVRL